MSQIDNVGLTRDAIRMIFCVTEGPPGDAGCHLMRLRHRRGGGCRGGRPKPWPEAPRGARGMGAISPPRKNSAAGPGGSPSGRCGAGEGWVSRPRGSSRGRPSLRRLRPRALDDDAGRVGGILQRLRRQVGVAFRHLAVAVAKNLLHFVQGTAAVYQEAGVGMA